MTVEYELLPCPCMCHHNPKMKHIKPCCENGWIKVVKVGPPKPKENGQ